MNFVGELKVALTDCILAVCVVDEYSDAWKKETFKPYNFNTLGLAVGGGHLHPLMKVRAEFRRVLMDMGYVPDFFTLQRCLCVNNVGSCKLNLVLLV